MKHSNIIYSDLPLFALAGVNPRFLINVYAFHENESCRRESRASSQSLKIGKYSLFFLEPQTLLSVHHF